MKAMIAVKTR